jgi:hypothetical protein
MQDGLKKVAKSAEKIVIGEIEGRWSEFRRGRF